MVDRTVGILKTLAHETGITIICDLISGSQLRTQELTKKFIHSQQLALLVNTYILNSKKEDTNWLDSLNSVYLLRIGIDIQKMEHAKLAHD